jgi:hypothetical protein
MIISTQKYINIFKVKPGLTYYYYYLFYQKIEV